MISFLGTKETGLFGLFLFLFNKQNNTWVLGDMEFIFSCSNRYLTGSLRSLVPYLSTPMYNSVFNLIHKILFKWNKTTYACKYDYGRRMPKINQSCCVILPACYVPSRAATCSDGAAVG